MLHRFDDNDLFHQRLQNAQLSQIAHSRALQRALAESYVGLPHRGHHGVAPIPPRDLMERATRGSRRRSA